MKSFLVWKKYSVATFTVNAGTTNYDVKTNNPDLFAIITSAAGVHIETSAAIGLKLNSVDNDNIPITTTQNTVSLPIFWVTNLFVTTTVNPAVITVTLQG